MKKIRESAGEPSGMFEKAVNNTLYQDVVSQICEMILTGSIRKGDLLPSEAKLCAQFQVSRTTVREALKILAKRKIIETIRGKGSIVISDSFSYLNEGIRAKIQQYESNFEYATQARQLLEPQIAALAARTATKKDIEDLEEIIRLCDEKERDGTLTSEDLRTFHFRVAEITHNPVLTSMVELLISMCDAPPETSIRVPNPTKPSRQTIMVGHEMVCAAIKAHNEEDAYFYMKENLKHFHDNCLSEY